MHADGDVANPPARDPGEAWTATAPGRALARLLQAAAERTEAALDALLPRVPGREGVLLDAMRYACLGGGKRMRAFLTIETARLFDADPDRALVAAASVEMLHAYSLIHDDLPAMDDDDLRRGRPSTHRAFDEAVAILAGDALQTRAFELLASEHAHPDPAIRIRLVASLAAASGTAGMVGGQMIDIEAEKAGARGEAVPLDEVRRLHALKTGCLIHHAALSGAILADAAPADLARISAYGRDVGTAFQVADDVLDATATGEQLGKTAGKDEASGKATYVSLLGVEGAAREAHRLADAANTHLDGFGEQADPLRWLARFTVERSA